MVITFSPSERMNGLGLSDKAFAKSGACPTAVAAQPRERSVFDRSAIDVEALTGQVVDKPAELVEDDFMLACATDRRDLRKGHCKSPMCILACFFAAVFFAGSVDAQLTVKLPKIPTKPPTSQDIEREVRNLGENVQKALDKLRDVDPAGASEETWGEAGRVAYLAAAQIMKRRSPRGETLDESTKRRLRREYRELVDRVTIHWGVSTLDEWAAAKFKIRLTDTDSVAQTYGYDVYTRWNRGEQSSTYILSLLSHELMHSRQYEQYGKSLSNFGYHYFKEYKKANQNYANNRLEREAFEMESRFDGDDSDDLAKGRERPDGVHKPASNQRWRFVDTPTRGEYIIESLASMEGRLALEYSTTGKVVVGKFDAKKASQRWLLEDAGAGTRLIVCERTRSVLDYYGRGSQKYCACVTTREGKGGKFGQKWMILKTPTKGEIGLWNPYAKEYLGYDKQKGVVVGQGSDSSSASGSGAKGADLSSLVVWIYGPNQFNQGGRFQKQGDEWVELQGGNSVARFREIQRGKEQIILHDAGRNMYIRLTPDGAWWRIGENGDWNFIYARQR